MTVKITCMITDRVGLCSVCITIMNSWANSHYGAVWVACPVHRENLAHVCPHAWNTERTERKNSAWYLWKRLRSISFHRPPIVQSSVIDILWWLTRVVQCRMNVPWRWIFRSLADTEILSRISPRDTEMFICLASIAPEYSETAHANHASVRDWAV